MASKAKSHKKVMELLGRLFSWRGTLREYIRLVCSKENLSQDKVFGILGNKDPDYRKCLNDIIVACSYNVDLAPKSPVCFTPWCSVMDSVHRVIKDCCRKGGENLLAIGASLVRHDSDKSYLGSLHDVQVNFPNSTVEFFSLPMWELLSSKIGDVLTHMLARLSLFIKVEDGCVVQLCGKPVEPKQVAEEDIKRKAATATSSDFSCKAAMAKSSDRSFNATMATSSDICSKTTTATSSDSSFNATLATTSDSSFNATLATSSESNRKALTATFSDICSKTMTSTSSDSGLTNGTTSDISFRALTLLYSRGGNRPLDKTHIMSSLTDRRKDAVLLALNIFETKCSETQSQKLPKQLLRSLALLRRFIRNFKTLNINSILNDISPISQDVRKFKTKGASKNASKKMYKAAVADFTPAEKVARFIIIVCQRTIPESLLGNDSNWKIFSSNIEKLLALGKYEYMSLSQFMTGMKITECTWMLKSGIKSTGSSMPKSRFDWQQKIQRTLVAWLVGNYVIPLTRAHFYVTESGAHNNRLFFYRKHTWKVIESLGKESFLSRNLTEVEQAAGEDASKVFGYVKPRFIPKNSKVRPVMISKKPDLRNISKENKDAYYRQVDLFHVLTFLHKHDRSLFGGAVQGRDDIGEKVGQFVADLRSNDADGLPKYWIASDVESCFDSVPHGKMSEVIDGVIRNGSYVVKRFSVMTYRNGKAKLSKRRLAAESYDQDPFPVFISKALRSGDLSLSHCIMTDCVTYSMVDKQGLMSSLKRNMKESLVKVDKKYYRMLTGIAQGSILSSLLANYLYGDLENKQLSGILNSKNSLLMRLTDDFLFITTSKEVAIDFLKKLKTGFPEYGFKINLSKSLTNLPIGVLGPPDPIKRTESDWFPWCGLLLNVHDLNVRVNFEKYEGEYIKDCMTQRLDKRPGEQLKSQLLAQVKHQSLSIILDPAINSPENIRVNIYQIFCFIAVKLNSQVARLPKHRRPNSNPHFYRGLINSLFTAFHSKYNKVAKKLNLECTPISRNEAEAVGLAALINTFERKECNYHAIYRFLKKRYRKLTKEDLQLYAAEGDIFLTMH